MKRGTNPQGKYPPELLGKAFKPGQSGNPTGKSKLCDRTVREIGRHMPELVQELLTIALENKKANNRIRAIELLMAYAIGKPSQKLEMSGGLEHVQRVIYEQLAPIQWETRWAAARLANQAMPVIDAQPDGAQEPVAVANGHCGDDAGGSGV